MDLTQLYTILVGLAVTLFQFFLIPVDIFLSQIPNIEAVPDAILGIVSFVSSIPSLLVNVTGVLPVLWNGLFLTFLLYLTAVPTMNLIKRVWAWTRW